MGEKSAKLPALLILLFISTFYFGIIGGAVVGIILTNLELEERVTSYLDWKTLIPFIQKGMFIGALSGFFFWIINFKIWKWKNLISFLTLFVTKKEHKRLIGSLSLGLSPGFFLGLIFGIGGLVLSLIGGLMISLAINSSGPIFISLEMGTIVGLIVWLTFMFVGGLFAVLTAFYNIEKGKEYIFEKKYLFFWWKTRPPLSEVKKALSCFSSEEIKEIMLSLEEKQKNPLSVEKLLSSLESENWRERWVSTQILVNLGGETVKYLKRELSNPLLKKKILYLLRNIAYETKKNLSDHFEKLVCPECIVYFWNHKIKIPESLEVITFYGCRRCFQSRKFVKWSKDIVAVLDKEMEEREVVENDRWYINYFKIGSPFDFNLVKIIRASDEEVERFCIQIGNDEDFYRRKNYKNIVCLISKYCLLQPETLNMLRSLFKEIHLR